ncbi:MAG: PDZ domain-containing protein [Nitrososphaeria archaeon]|nr:PDZ domain-containing protein [Nitrososphaeria archaeon]NIQ33411.1 PDZ domain-containing protein [Nitrososphaeria archaeon]
MSRKTLTIVAVIFVIALAILGFNSYLILDSIRIQQDVQKANEASIQNIQNRLGNIQNDIHELEKRIRYVESTSVSQGGNLSSIAHQVSIISETSSDSINKIDTLNQSTFSTIADLRDELTAQSISLADNLTQINKSLNSIFETQSSLEDIRSTVGILNSSLEGLASDVSNLEEIVRDFLNQTPANVYEASHKSVVVIRTATGQGSGFVYSSHSHNMILTNWHVVESEIDIDVEFYDGTRRKAALVGADAYSDIAVLMVSNTPSDAKPLQLGDSSKLWIGKQVVAIGNPLGLTGSLSSGYISQINRLLDLPPIIVPVIQLDITIAPGSSGGPLFDLSGNVVGITNAGTSVGLNFAVPSNIVKRVATSLIEKGYYLHPFVGFQAYELNPETIRSLNVLNIEPFQTGLLIINVIPDSPAARAGLRGGVVTQTPDGSPAYLARDIILAVDDHPTLTFEDWSAYIEEQVSPDQPITLTLWRSGEIVSIVVTPTFRQLYQE